MPRVRSLPRPLAAVALAGLGYFALGLVISGPVRPVVCTLVTAAVALGVGVTTLGPARRSTGRARQSGTCLAAGALTWGLGAAAHVVAETISGPAPVHALPDLALAVAAGLFVLGAMLHPALTGTGLSVLRAALDGVIIVSSVLLFMTAMASAADPSGGSAALASVVQFVYPLVDIVVVAVVLLGLRGLRRGRQTSLPWVLGALTCFVAGTNTYHLGWPLEAGWLIGFLLLWFASRTNGVAESLEQTGDVELSRLQSLLRRVVGVLPYAAVGVTMTVGATVYFQVQFVLTTTHTAVALVMIGAMIARQSVSVLDASSAIRELARGEAYFRSIVQGSSDVTTILGENLRVVWQSPSVRTVFGIDDRLAVGRFVDEIVHRDDLPELERAMASVLASASGSASLRARIRDAAGRWREVETSISNHLATTAIKGLVLHTRDITERSALETRLHEMAFTDALTALPNRRLFLDRVEEARERLVRTGETHTVLAVDLDGFKAVNDLHGHGAGDALLAEVSNRLRGEVREVDTVARLGGDEFAVLVVGPAQEGLGLGQRLVSSVAAPYTLGGVTVHVSVSIGVAEALLGDDGAVVLRNADLALRHAKQTGKKHVEVYEPALHQGALDRVAIEHDLAGALERGEIRLVYQPIFDLVRDRVVAAEALMRWQHPTRGEVSPVDFIPIAEDSGQIVELGRWALDEACRQLAVWSAAGYELQMGVNVSTRQLRGTENGGSLLCEDVAAACAAHGVLPQRLVLEITESAFLDSFETVVEELEALHDLGVNIALDDFGTGYSSLSYLRRLPVDILKIDREFVSGMTTEDHVAALAELVVRLGDRLGIDVVAEGVETAAEAAGVLGIGCVLGQGYHLGRPVAPVDFDAVLAANAPSTESDAEQAVPGVTV